MSVEVAPQPASGIDFGRVQVITRNRLWSGRIDVRAVLVSLVMMLATFGVVIASLMTGTFSIPLRDVVDALTGSADGPMAMVVMEWRLPRALLAVLLGAALAVSGAMFQSITRNPLGSPDIIGFSSGAYTGALLVIIGTGGGYWATAGGALAGGLLTAIAVFGLAYRGGVQGFRLIIVGIGVAALLGSVNTYMMLKSPQEDMMRAGIWGSGSLNGLGTDMLWPVLGVLAVLVPLAFVLVPAMTMLELGDDAASATGARPTATRLCAMLVGVALLALVTATAGPIAFIALVAPQISRRLTRSAGIGLVSAAVTGAFLLTSADWIAQRMFAPVQLPVGVVTVSIGGLYFVWLLIREGRGR